MFTSLLKRVHFLKKNYLLEELSTRASRASARARVEALAESLEKTCASYKMEIRAEKTKLMTNSANGIQREIKVKGRKSGTVISFKYLGAVV